MTKAAVRRQYEEFLDRQSDKILDAVQEEFGGGITGRIVRSGGKAVLRRIESDMRDQGRLVVERAAAIAAGEDDQRYENEFLQTNPVFQKYEGSEQETLRQDLLEHFEAVSHDLAPLVASDCDDFWDALRSEYDRDAAIAIIERHFDQASTFKRYRDGIFERDVIEEKTIAIIERAEADLRSELMATIDEIYDE